MHLAVRAVLKAGQELDILVNFCKRSVCLEGIIVILVKASRPIRPRRTWPRRDGLLLVRA